jgi:Arc/MetJ-type ribon-helix-helix transcriptional regulator
MAKPSIVVQKKGRPSTGAGDVTAIRLSPELRASVDRWREQQPDQPSRSEAIRRLVEQALSGSQPKHKTKLTTRRAAEGAMMVEPERVQRGNRKQPKLIADPDEVKGG